MHRLLLEAILEDIFSDLIKKYPEQEISLNQAKQKGVKPKYFQWIAKILQRTKEPINDIIPVINAFDAKQKQIQAKFGGNSGDINSYQTVADLSNRLESLSGSSNTNPGGEVLYEDETWMVVFPRTTEESCASGKNTSWCTARTQSSNLFLSYTGRSDGIFLFYVLNKGMNPRANPNAKISVGFNKGEPVFDGQDGGMTVNGNNDGITREQFENIVGPKNASRFLTLMTQKIEQLGGKHPASAELEQVANDYNKFIAKVKTFKHEEEHEDFLGMVLSQPTVSQEILQWFMQDFNGKRALLDNSNITHTTPEMLAQLGNDEARDVRVMVAKNKKTPQKTLVDLIMYDDPKINYALSKNIGAGKALINLFHADRDADFLAHIARNPSAPPELLRKIYSMYNHSPFMIDLIASNTQTPVDLLQTIINNSAKHDPSSISLAMQTLKKLNNNSIAPIS
jgi:hypothetical protein